jgi:hypothetical protein
MIVRFVDIFWIVDNDCLNFLYIMKFKKQYHTEIKMEM